MSFYDHKIIEAKWQKYWDAEETFFVADKAKRKRVYVLDMFPYPSAQGLHVGHPEGYTATDIYCRYLRMKGMDVLHPMGWDAFGLPAENYAIKTGVHPRDLTQGNIDNFRRQIKSLGLSYDWLREINTADPSYYKWTQWLFLQLYKKGLAYQKEAPVNWCPSCQTVLANEQVENGACQRCHSQVEQRQMKQWFFKITAYAEKLLQGLNEVDWPAPILEMQKNWIGKSEGAEVEFDIKNNYNYLILHAFKSTPQDTFYPWLKKELEKFGYRVQMPHLPEPAEEKWVDIVLQDCQIDENTVLVGHSLGAVTAMKVLEKMTHKVAGLVMAGGFVVPKFKDKHRSLEETFIWNFDFKKIKNNLGFIKILSDINDPIVPIDQGRIIHQELGGELLEVQPTESHFDGLQEPFVLSSALPSVNVFTTRLDTIFGVTYLVLAPEHSMINELKSQIKNWSEVEKYIKKSQSKTELERKMETKEKTGVKLDGVMAINPANNEEIPVFIADYVLTSYGTGAIMAVPAHDERDFAFAKKFDLPIKQVIALHLIDPYNPPRADYKTVKRETVHVILQRRSDKKVLILKWKGEMWGSHKPSTFLIGGTDRDDLETAARREILEEAGYDNVKLIKKLNFVIHAEYCAAHKEQNRYAEVHALCFELIDDMQQEVAAHEQTLHDLKWVEESQVPSELNIEDDLLFWNLYTQGDKSFTGDGVLVNSDSFSSLSSIEAVTKIAQKIGAELKTQYRLRDWLISRQRYWGAPIPIIYCEACGSVPVPEKDLPVELPNDVDFRPTGESPLVRSKLFHQVRCPNCGAEARRESDTMDTFVDSSWYFLRYPDPQNTKKAFDPKKVNAWCPVNLYVGGAEHAVMHLLYARFITKVLADLGHINFSEPFLKLKNQGLILGEDGQKMSKSKGNVVNPDEIVEKYGADTLRLYEMFMGPLEDAKPWNTSSIVGIKRFLDKVWNLGEKILNDNSSESKNSLLNKELNIAIAKTTKKVTEDILTFRFNTAISSLMELLNILSSSKDNIHQSYVRLIVLLYPFAPHLTSELWKSLKLDGQIWEQPWPTYNEMDLVTEKVLITVQVNGKLRGRIECAVEANEAEVLQLAQVDPDVAKYLTDNEIVKSVYVRGRLINLVVK